MRGTVHTFAALALIICIPGLLYTRRASPPQSSPQQPTEVIVSHRQLQATTAKDDSQSTTVRVSSLVALVAAQNSIGVRIATDMGGATAAAAAASAAASAGGVASDGPHDDSALPENTAAGGGSGSSSNEEAARAQADGQQQAIELPHPLTIRRNKLHIAGAAVYPMEGAHFALPPEVKRVAIEIGLFRTSDLLPALELDPELFIFAFDPNAPKFFARYRRQHGGSLPPRNFHVVSAAVTTNTGFAGFKQIEGCSTLGAIRRNPKLLERLGPQARCVPETYKTTKVPTVSLEVFLRLIPPHIRVVLVKIDAQGEDLKAAESAQSQMPRVERLLLEAQAIPLNHWAKLYDDGFNTTLAASALRRRGLNLQCCLPNNPDIWEVNCLFHRDGAAALPWYNLCGRLPAGAAKENGSAPGVPPRRVSVIAGDTSPADSSATKAAGEEAS